MLLGVIVHFATAPDGWEVVPFRKRFAITRKHRDEVARRSTVPFIPMDKVPIGKLFFSNYDLRSHSEIGSGTYFKDGDLLLSKITPSFENGKQGIATSIPGGHGIATTEVIPIHATHPDAHLPYLAFYLLRSDVRASLADKMEGATGRRRLSKHVLENLPIPMPPPAEQRAIASVLSKIQAAVETQDRIVAKLQELKTAIMAKIFREGLQGEPLKKTEAGEIPESWDLSPCGELCREITVGIVVTPAKYYVTEGVPCLRSLNVKADRLQEQNFVFISPGANDLHAKSRLNAGDVLIVRSGYPGAACVVPEKYSGANCIDLIVARPNNDRVVSDYLARYINSEEGARQVLMAQGGLAQQHFNVGAMKRLLVALPPAKDEQVRISQIGQTLDSKIDSAATDATSMRRLFTSTLHLLMTGQLRVGSRQPANPK